MDYDDYDHICTTQRNNLIYSGGGVDHVFLLVDMGAGNRSGVVRVFHRSTHIQVFSKLEGTWNDFEDMTIRRFLDYKRKGQLSYTYISEDQAKLSII
jgi:hypothetical protein